MGVVLVEPSHVGVGLGRGVTCRIESLSIDNEGNFFVVGELFAAVYCYKHTTTWNHPHRNTQHWGTIAPT